MENNGEKSQLSASIAGREEENIDLEASNEQTNHIDTEDSSSKTNKVGQELSVSNNESEIAKCVHVPDQFEPFSGIRLIRLEGGGREHNFVKQRFFSGMRSLETTVVAIHKYSYSSFPERARLQSFKIFSQAMTEKRGRNANIKHTWYSTSIDEICKIVSHGFSQSGRPENRNVYGVGIYLFPEDSSIDCAVSSVVDKDGLRHIMLCRAILGNLEVVHLGSQQFHPSSEQFDSGVDNFSSPGRFIVWTTHMNTHILPVYIITFRVLPCSKGLERMQERMVKPTSPWVSFPTLISVLSQFLPLSTIAMIAKYDQDYREKKITRQILVQRVRLIAGDKLLLAIIKSCRSNQKL